VTILRLLSDDVEAFLGSLERAEPKRGQTSGTARPNFATDLRCQLPNAEGAGASAMALNAA